MHETIWDLSEFWMILIKNSHFMLCLILEVIIGLHLMEIMKEVNKEWILMLLSSFSLNCQTHIELDVIKITCVF